MQVLPVEQQCSWRADFGEMEATEEFRFLDEPSFGPEKPWRHPEPPVSFAKPGDRMDWIVQRRRAGAVSASIDVVGFQWKRSPVTANASWPAWEWRRVVPVPCEPMPADSRTIEAARLLVGWHPDFGLSLTAEPAPPAPR